MIFILILAGIIMAFTAISYLSVIVIKKVNKPKINELLNPSKNIIDFANQGKLDEFQKNALLSVRSQHTIEF